MKDQIKSVVVVVEPRAAGMANNLDLFLSPNFVLDPPAQLIGSADAAMSLNGALMEWARSNEIRIRRSRPLSDAERESLLDQMGPPGCTAGYFLSTQDFRYNVFCELDAESAGIHQAARQLGWSPSDVRRLREFRHLLRPGAQSATGIDASSNASPPMVEHSSEAFDVERTFYEEAEATAASSSRKRWWQFWKYL